MLHVGSQQVVGFPIGNFQFSICRLMNEPTPQNRITVCSALSSVNHLRVNSWIGILSFNLLNFRQIRVISWIVSQLGKR